MHRRAKARREKRQRLLGMGKPVTFVSDALIAELQRQYLLGLWREYRKSGLPLWRLAAEIGMTRPALTNFLRRKSRGNLATFWRTLFLIEGPEKIITIASEGRKIELRLAVTKGNDRYL